MAGSNAAHLFEAFASVFRKSLSSRLRDVKKYCSSQKPPRDFGDQVICYYDPHQTNEIYYSASIVTNSTLGDINGRYTFYESPRFPDDDLALTHLTSQVAFAALKHPDIQFIRNHSENKFFFSGEWLDYDDQPTSKKLNKITNYIE